MLVEADRYGQEMCRIKQKRLGAAWRYRRTGLGLDDSQSPRIPISGNDSLCRQRFATKTDARRAVARFIDSYNHRRRQPSEAVISLIRKGCSSAGACAVSSSGPGRVPSTT